MITVSLSNNNYAISVALVKLAILQENLDYMYRMCLYLFDTRFFLTEINICSFNNIALKKCPNGKAFYIMATMSPQFFATLI